MRSEKEERFFLQERQVQKLCFKAVKLINDTKMNELAIDKEINKYDINNKS